MACRWVCPVVLGAESVVWTQGQCVLVAVRPADVSAVSDMSGLQPELGVLRGARLEPLRQPGVHHLRRAHPLLGCVNNEQWTPLYLYIWSTKNGVREHCTSRWLPAFLNACRLIVHSKEVHPLFDWTKSLTYLFILILIFYSYLGWCSPLQP